MKMRGELEMATNEESATFTYEIYQERLRYYGIFLQCPHVAKVSRFGAISQRQNLCRLMPLCLHLLVS